MNSNFNNVACAVSVAVAVAVDAMLL